MGLDISQGKYNSFFSVFIESVHPLLRTVNRLILKVFQQLKLNFEYAAAQLALGPFRLKVSMTAMLS